MSDINTKFNTLNKRFDEITKKYKIAQVIFPIFLYFVGFLFIDLILLLTCNGTHSVQFDIVLGTRIDVVIIIFLSTVCFAFPKLIQMIVYDVLSMFFLLYGFAQTCCYADKGDMIRLSSISSAQEGAGFAGDVVAKMSVGTFILYISGVAVTILFTFLVAKFGVKRADKKVTRIKTIICLAVMVVTFIPIIFINSKYENDDDGEIDFNSYTITNFTSPSYVYKHGDFYDYMVRDIRAVVKISADREKNIETAKECLSSKGEHTNNDMTGVFKGKNLMIIQLESMDYRVLNETFSPNLTKLMNESINFTNFYTPRFGDTLTFGTQTAVNTGLFSASGFNESNNLASSTFPYSLANAFTSDGYAANEFHFNTPDFYNRGVMSKVYGYEKYNMYSDLLTDKNVNTEIDDVLCNDGLYDALIENDKFLDFIITYSAHEPYSTEGVRYKEAASRHPDLVDIAGDGVEGSFKMQATLTDDMVGEFMEKLDNDGVLDNTVVMFITDHYGIAADESFNGDDQRYNNTPFFIYCKGFDAKTVDKVCKTSDVLPTLLNLFGYDVPNEYLGEDIFDESYDGFAYFPNLSWITAECYCSNGEIVENYTDKDISQEYIDEMNERAKKYTQVNTTFLYYDYYSLE